MMANEQKKKIVSNMTCNSIRLFGKVAESIVDGPGIRYAIFCQGCYHHCEGCHNPESHAIDGGEIYQIEQLIQEIKENPLLDGITLSGGEPMLQALACLEIIKAARNLKLPVMMYTGYVYEQVDSLLPEQKELFFSCDSVVDGRFEKEQRSLSLYYRGSKNQRIIDIKKSLEDNKCIVHEIDSFGQLR